MIGGLSRTATAALRQLLDAGTLSNLPSGFKTRGIRVRDEGNPYNPESLETSMHQVVIFVKHLCHYLSKSHQAHYYN